VAFRGLSGRGPRCYPAMYVQEVSKDFEDFVKSHRSRLRGATRNAKQRNSHPEPVWELVEKEC